jgi:hypothetical protein
MNRLRQQQIADQEDAPLIAARIRSLKWLNNAMIPMAIRGFEPLSKSA